MGGRGACERAYCISLPALLLAGCVFSTRPERTFLSRRLGRVCCPLIPVPSLRAWAPQPMVTPVWITNPGDRFSDIRLRPPLASGQSPCRPPLPAASWFDFRPAFAGRLTMRRQTRAQGLGPEPSAVGGRTRMSPRRPCSGRSAFRWPPNPPRQERDERNAGLDPVGFGTTNPTPAPAYTCRHRSVANAQASETIRGPVGNDEDSDVPMWAHRQSMDAWIRPD